MGPWDTLKGPSELGFSPITPVVGSMSSVVGWPEIKEDVANYVDGKEKSPFYSWPMPSSVWGCQNRRRQ